MDSYSLISFFSLIVLPWLLYIFYSHSYCNCWWHFTFIFSYLSIYFYLLFEVHVLRSNTWDRFFGRNRRPPSHAQRLCSVKANQTAWLNARTWGCGAAPTLWSLWCWGPLGPLQWFLEAIGAAFMMFRGLCAIQSDPIWLGQIHAKQHSKILNNSSSMIQIFLWKWFVNKVLSRKVCQEEKAVLEKD